MGRTQTIRTGRQSLAHQAALRLVISLGLFVTLLSYASYKAYTVTLQKSAHDRAEYLSSYFHTRLQQLDRDWELQALDEKTRIENTQLLTSSHVDVVRLQAFLTMQDTGKRMQYLLIQDWQGNKVFEFGANLSLERIPISTRLDNGWYHPDQNRLYRVFVAPIWLGKEGMGHLAVFYEIDNALLFNLATPGITLIVEHDGMQFATSSGHKMADPAHSGNQDDEHTEVRTILWNTGDAEETFLRIDAPVHGLFTKTELVIGAAIIPVIDGLILLFTFGFWLMRHTQRLRKLGSAVQEFSERPQSIASLQENLDAAKDGQSDEISEVAIALKDMMGQTLMREHERQEEEAQRRLWAMVFANTHEAILITDRNNNIITVNEAFTRLTGYKEKEVVGENPHILSAGNQTPEFYESMWKQIAETGGWAGEVQDKRKDGSIYPKWLNISVVRDAEGQVANYIGIFQDITERKANEERLAFLANHDVLTGLPNRHLLLDRLENDIALARRTSQPIGLMFLDLDNFKWVNDTLGHASGDQLLISVATRLKETVRASDTVARLGGDEFVVLLTQTESDLEMAQVAGKIIASVSRPLDLAGHEFHVTTSMGISVYPNDGDDAATLLKHADTAMYVAKSSGKNQFRYFDAAMNRNALERVELERDLRHAVKNSEFELHYQPKLCVITDSVISAEALIRWRHPRHGLMSPDKFIPLAEETSLINDLGEWVIRSACLQIGAWQQQGIKVQRVAVNLSAPQLESDSFVGLVENILKETGASADALELELTESVVLHNPDKTVTNLSRLHELGIRLALDDFGTGYSSLSYLKRLPVDVLKIDRSFVEGLPDDADDRQIVRMICALAKSVGLEIVAEGIETEAQRHFMIGLDCDFLQGYLISKPLPADEFVAFLLESNRQRT